MATETNSQQTESLTSLAARVKKLEEHESGWSLARMGIVIGCLGGLIGGLSTLRQMWLQWSAQPHFEVVALHGDNAWVRDVQSGADHLALLARCRKINGQPLAAAGE